MSKLEIEWTHYHRYDELTSLLEQLHQEFPRLSRLYSIGQSHQGREVWVMELTDLDTGPGVDKPGYYLDANCHGEEVLGSSVALYTIWYILTRFEEDERVRQLLRRRVLYVLPRINPDGAEHSLTTPFHHVGNGHYLPWEYEPEVGLVPADINGDGYLLQMRLPDEAGEWKKSSRDPRLMVQRKPGETGGQYYRMFPEGYVNGYNGADVSVGKPPHGNLNRQFPVHWGPEREEYGAGQLPLNEPEARAVAEFILSHPNIAGGLAHHTHGGLILRPSSYRPDSELPPEDVQLFSALGSVGEELTGYKLAGIFQDFTTDKRNARHGGFTDWLYEQLGIPALATELWDIELEAGLREPRTLPQRGGGEDKQLKLLEWADRETGGRAFIDWQEFEHSQLGTVEIGGWDSMFLFRNPPGKFIEKLARPVCEFTIRMAGTTPLVEVAEVSTEGLCADLFRVRAVVKNQGYLPTNLTTLGLETGDIGGVEVKLELVGAQLEMNPAHRDMGHFDGMSSRRQLWSGWGPQWRQVACPVEWLVRATGPEARAVVTVRAQKGGTHKREVSIR